MLTPIIPQPLPITSYEQWVSQFEPMMDTVDKYDSARALSTVITVLSTFSAIVFASAQMTVPLIVTIIIISISIFGIVHNHTQYKITKHLVMSLMSKYPQYLDTHFKEKLRRP